MVVDTGATQTAGGVEAVANFLDALRQYFGVVAWHTDTLDRPWFWSGNGWLLQALDRLCVVTVVGLVWIYLLDALMRTKSLLRAPGGLTPSPWILWWESRSLQTDEVVHGQPMISSCCQSRSTHIGDAAGRVCMISPCAHRSCIQEQLRSLCARLAGLQAVDGLPPGGMDMGGHRSDQQRHGGPAGSPQPGVGVVCYRDVGVFPAAHEIRLCDSCDRFPARHM